MSKTMRTWIFSAFVLAGGSLNVMGQTTAEIAGTIRDASGAVVPGAPVTVANVDTGIRRTTLTNEAGYWIASLLQPGRYTVTVCADGFKPVVRSGIVLHISERTVVDMSLEVGVVSEEIPVISAAPLLETTNATQGQVIDNQRIVDLPLNGRDYIQLALLSAGALAPPRNAEFGGFSASGMRADQNNFLLDGMDNNSLQRTGQGQQAEAVKPSVDSIQEFKLLTNNYSAEYGRASGGVVNVSMKSGTNEFHGTVYEFLRNEKLDAKNFFDSPTAPRPPFKRNQYGFSLGGPIIKSRTFFFGDYEGTRIRESRTVNATIATRLQASGNFSENLPGTRIYDPATAASASSARMPFPGKIIPPSRFDRVGGLLASLYPAPNKAGLVRNYLANPADNEDVRRWDAKVDHTISEKSNLSARYSSQYREIPQAPVLPPPAWGAGTTASDYKHDGQNVMLAYNRFFSPSFIWELKLGWNRFDTARLAPTQENLNATLLKLPGVEQPAPGMAQFSMTGYQALGIGNFNPNLVNTQNRQLISNFSWIRNTHSVKWGANILWQKHSLNNSQQAHGLFNFDASFTRNTATKQEGNAVADLLLGHPITSQTSNFIWEDMRRPVYQFFVQDEWRASPRLAVNFGVRYELYVPWVDRLNKIANTDISDFARPVTVLAREGSRRDRALVNTDWNNFTPRLGIAYKVNNRTILRTGYGLFIGGTIWKPLLMQNPPFHFKAALTSGRVIPELQLARGLPDGILGFGGASNILIETQDVNFALPYSQQWNFAVQREMPWDAVLEVGYYANTTIKLTQQYDIDQALPGAGNVNPRRPQQRVFVPDFDASITLGQKRYTAGSSNANFHSLQLRYEKRLSHGLTVMGAYIWSKTISDARGGGASGGASTENPQDWRNLRLERSVADEHTPNRFVTSYVYELPFGRGRKYLAGMKGTAEHVLGGWTLGGIFTAASGPPANLTVQGNPSNSGGADRPNVLRDWRLSRDARSLDRFFDTGAFAKNAAFTFGNAGRNLLQAPGSVNYDFAVCKTFDLAERFRLQFRTEAFNFTNTPQFFAPNTQVGNVNFGIISSADRAEESTVRLEAGFLRT